MIRRTLKARQAVEERKPRGTHDRHLQVAGSSPVARAGPRSRFLTASGNNDEPADVLPAEQLLGDAVRLICATNLRAIGVDVLEAALLDRLRRQGKERVFEDARAQLRADGGQDGELSARP